MQRRDFLKNLGVGFGGYSVLVNLDGTEPGPAAQAAEITVEQLRKDFNTIAPLENRQPAAAEPHMTLVPLSCDVLVAGGGMAGVCAAIAAARHGAKVVLVQDRSRLGGNASSEVKMHIVGADNHGSRAGWREGGLIEEFRLEDAVNNSHRSWELWDLMLYDKVKSEPNITLLLDSVLFAVEMEDTNNASGDDNGGRRIKSAMVRCDKTEHLYPITAKVFCDCTGDSRLGLEAGAEMRWGREARDETKEPLALKSPDAKTLGSSILFTARDYDRPIPFTPPKWARKVKKENLRFRGIGSWEYGYWWIEWGGAINTIADNERIRFELLGIVLGVWDYIKNSGAHPNSANWGMDWVGMVPGKRESRRIIGDHLLNQMDLMGLNGDFDDAVCIGGWPLDDHPPSGFDDPNLPPYVSIKLPEVYNIPLRSLYSSNVPNLMMAGRNISATHVAFCSTRVMATCAVMGQAVGTAAAVCARESISPRQLAGDKTKLAELQQTLLRDDQTIKNRKNIDQLDLARQAKVTASGRHETASPENVLDGLVRDAVGKHEHRWAALLPTDAKPDAGDPDSGAWLELTWPTTQKLRQVQITFDSGFHRELTLSASNGVTKRMVRAPQPETVRDYSLWYRKPGEKKFTKLLDRNGNYQRLARHEFETIEADTLRLQVRATNGDQLARVFEVRCYA